MHSTLIDPDAGNMGYLAKFLASPDKGSMPSKHSRNHSLCVNTKLALQAHYPDFPAVEHPRSAN
jgi:hypothetical protein